MTEKGKIEFKAETRKVLPNPERIGGLMDALLIVEWLKAVEQRKRKSTI